MPKSPNNKPVGEDDFCLLIWLCPGIIMLVLAFLFASRFGEILTALVVSS